MAYAATLRGETFRFPDLRDLLAKANEEKSGDQLAGIAATSERQRVAAKMALADVPLAEIVATPLIEDDVTALVDEALDRSAFAALAALTVGELRELLLTPELPAQWDAHLRRAITPEVAAAVAKVMGNKDLVLAAAGLKTVTRCRNTQGGPGVLGVRVQPNHPADDVAGVLVSTLDGLLFGCGDAVIGVNPARESVAGTAALLHGIDDLIRALGVPTQACVLAHVTTQLAALEAGAPVDLLFQSVAGTQGANASFGITLSLLGQARQAVLAEHATRPEDFVGEQVTYFETGQGTALSAGAHAGIDQLTCEARAQAVARAFDPFLVNSVVGFIGPEYLADARQIGRAGLEDHFVGKLLGINMGVDVCYTNHVAADQNSNDDLLVLLAAAGCSYVMGVPASDDVMLGYQSTSFHDAAGVRALLGLGPAPEFAAWCEARGILAGGRLATPPPATVAALVGGLDEAVARRAAPGAGGAVSSDPMRAADPGDRADPTDLTALTALAARVRAATPARVFTGRVGASYRTATLLELRADHAAARDAVLAPLDLAAPGLAALVGEHGLFETTSAAADMTEHLRRPDLGRRLSADAKEVVTARCPRGADLQVVVGDGLSARAVEVGVPALLPQLLRDARAAGWTTGRPFAVRHCRVGVLNDVGELLDPTVVVLLIGERPGLGNAESLSAYLAWRPRAGHTDADRNLISNISARGVPYAQASRLVLALAAALRAAGTSGVAIKEAAVQGLSMPERSADPLGLDRRGLDRR